MLSSRFIVPFRSQAATRAALPPVTLAAAGDNVTIRAFCPPRSPPPAVRYDDPASVVTLTAEGAGARAPRAAAWTVMVAAAVRRRRCARRLGRARRNLRSRMQRFWVRDLLGCVVPRWRPCGVAIKTLVDLIKLAGEFPSFIGTGWAELGLSLGTAAGWVNFTYPGWQRWCCSRRRRGRWCCGWASLPGSLAARCSSSSLPHSISACRPLPPLPPQSRASPSPARTTRQHYLWPWLVAAATRVRTTSERRGCGGGGQER